MNRPPLEVEMLIPEDKRRVSVNDHAAFLQSITTPPHVDEIDTFVEELRQAEFEGKGARP